MSEDIRWVLGIAVTIIFTVIAALLRQKDAAQERQLADFKARVKDDIEKLRASDLLLFKKHDDDSDRLDAFELQVAGKHYERTELDAKMDRMSDNITRQLESLSAEIRHLTRTVIEHVAAPKGDKQ